MNTLSMGDECVVLPRKGGDNQNVGEIVVIVNVFGDTAMCRAENGLLNEYGNSVKQLVFGVDRLAIWQGVTV